MNAPSENNLLNVLGILKATKKASAKGPEPRKVYANLIVHDGGSKPTEQECTDGLAALQTDYDNAQTKKATDKTTANQK